MSFYEEGAVMPLTETRSTIEFDCSRYYKTAVHVEHDEYVLLALSAPIVVNSTRCEEVVEVLMGESG